MARSRTESGESTPPQESFFMLDEVLGKLQGVKALRDWADADLMDLVGELGANGKLLKESVYDARKDNNFFYRMRASMDPTNWTYAGFLAKKRLQSNYSVAENVTDEEFKLAWDKTETLVTTILDKEISLKQMMGEDAPSYKFKDLPKALGIYINSLKKLKADPDAIDELTSAKNALEKEIRLLSGKTTWMQAALDIPITAGVVLADTLAVLVAIPVAGGAGAAAMVVSAMYCVAAISAAVWDLGNYLTTGVTNSALNGLEYSKNKLQEKLVSDPFVDKTRGIRRYDEHAIMTQEQLATFKSAAIATIVHDVNQSSDEIDNQLMALQRMTYRLKENGSTQKEHHEVFTKEEISGIKDRLEKNKSAYHKEVTSEVDPLASRIATCTKDLAQAREQRAQLATLKGGIEGIQSRQFCQMIHQELSLDIQDRIDELFKLKQEQVKQEQKSFSKSFETGRSAEVYESAKGTAKLVSEKYKEVMSKSKEGSEEDPRNKLKR